MSDNPTGPDAPVVLTGEQITRLRGAVGLMAYRVAARSGGRMHLSAKVKVTVRGFNSDYGTACKTWGDVKAVLTAAGVRP